MWGDVREWEVLVCLEPCRELDVWRELEGWVSARRGLGFAFGAAAARAGMGADCDRLGGTVGRLGLEPIARDVDGERLCAGRDPEGVDGILVCRRRGRRALSRLSNAGKVAGERKNRQESITFARS